MSTTVPSCGSSRGPRRGPGLQVGVVEDDASRLAAEFEADPLDTRCGQRGHPSS